MLAMSNLSKVYQTHMIETHALRGISLDVAEGEFVAVTGPSGSGKTTFLNIAGLLEEFTEGSFHLDGVDVRGLSDDARSKLRNEKLGFIFQSYNLIQQLTVVENIEVPLYYQGVPEKESREIAVALANKVGLGKRLDHRPNELSGGQQQRVAIARALSNDPPVILADEATGNLDSKSGGDILEIFDALNAGGKTLILITHDEGMALRTSRTIRLKDGVIAVDSRREAAARG